MRKVFIGQKIGKLEVVERLEKRSYDRQTIWRLRCICGKEIEAMTSEISGDKVLTCGCRQKINYTKEKVRSLINDAYLNVEVDESKIYNPLLEIPDELQEVPHLYMLWLLSRPEYFSFICREIFNVELLPFQALILKELWGRKFPMLIGARGLGKSFLLGLYGLMRLVLMPGRKVIITGAAFRQSKVIFEYMEQIWGNAPLLRNIADTNKPIYRGTDLWSFRLFGGKASAIPLGTGEKIRGQRANDIFNDEFASTPRDIFENVIAGFAAVTATPVENVRQIAAKKKMVEFGLDVIDLEEDRALDNQIVLSGTAYYSFNHFAEYWKKWRAIVNSKGDKDKLEVIFGEDEIPAGFNWKDYSVIRIPYDLSPEGFLDADQISRSKASIHAGIFDMEFNAIFSDDSDGFYKRSLIEKAVVKPDNEIIKNGHSIMFYPVLRGLSSKKYIYGIDPASQKDRFAIVVLELHEDHRRIVYVWSTNKSSHRAELKAGLVQETDYYAYCARKIRNLMKSFPCECFAIDTQGGGERIMEALHDPDKMELGEILIWPTIDPQKPKPEDAEIGLHIADLINFADAKFTSEANHGMRFDLETQTLLFPYFDSLSLGLADLNDTIESRLYDTLEEVHMEIEELKDELASISITQTPSGRDKWDTPEVKLPDGKKGRQLKDRYSALLMANYSARIRFMEPVRPDYESGGGWANIYKKPAKNQNLFNAPGWFMEAMRGVYD